VFRSLTKPDLIEILQTRDHDLHDKTVYALAKVIKGPKIVEEELPVLKRAVASEHIFVRLGAVEAIGEIGPDAHACKQILRKLQQVEIVSNVKEAIASALVKISDKP